MQSALGGVARSPAVHDIVERGFLRARCGDRGVGGWKRSGDAWRWFVNLDFIATSS